MNRLASLDRVGRGARPEAAPPRRTVPTAVARAPARPPGTAPSVRPVAWNADSDIQHLLDGLAGFYPGEADALAAVQQLGSTHGLQSSQLVVMGPADAGWLRFIWQARQWNQRPHGSRHGLRLRTLGAVGLLGAAAGLMAALALLDFESLFGPALELLAVLAAVVGGATTAAGLVALLHSQQPQFKDFDRTVRHKLASGAWAVLVHDLRWAQQTGAVRLIRRQGKHWCAVSSARRQM